MCEKQKTCPDCNKTFIRHYHALFCFPCANERQRISSANSARKARLKRINAA